MVKKSLKSTLLGVILIVVGIILFFIVGVGDQTWQPTIEKAYKVEVEDFPEKRMEQSLGLFYYENEAMWLYVTKEGMFYGMWFKYSEKRDKWTEFGGYQVYLQTIKDRLAATYDPNDPDNNALYLDLVGKKNCTLRGIRYHDDRIIYVNGERADVYTYDIPYEGETYSIDYWEIRNFDKALYESKVIELRDN